MPNLDTIDLSGNNQLTTLGPNTFDGAFTTSTAVRPRVLLTDSVLTFISKRAFNFDTTGISSAAVVALGSAVDSPGLSTCCGYEWLVIDRHFSTNGLKCVDTLTALVTNVSVSVAVDSDDATLHCCIEDVDLASMREMRALNADPDMTSFVSLPAAVQSNVTRLCQNADWVTEGGSVVRSCGADCTLDTAPSETLVHVLQPDATSCTSGLTTCPSG